MSSDSQSRIYLISATNGEKHSNAHSSGIEKTGSIEINKQPSIRNVSSICMDWAAADWRPSQSSKICLSLTACACSTWAGAGKAMGNSSPMELKKAKTSVCIIPLRSRYSLSSYKKIHPLVRNLGSKHGRSCHTHLRPLKKNQALGWNEEIRLHKLQ